MARGGARTRAAREFGNAWRTLVWIARRRRPPTEPCPADASTTKGGLTTAARSRTRLRSVTAHCRPCSFLRIARCKLATLGAKANFPAARATTGSVAACPVAYRAATTCRLASSSTAVSTATYAPCTSGRARAGARPRFGVPTISPPTSATTGTASAPPLRAAPAP